MSTVAHRWLGLPTADPHVTLCAREARSNHSPASQRGQYLPTYLPTYHRLNRQVRQAGTAQTCRPCGELARYDPYGKQHHARPVAIRPRPESTLPRKDSRWLMRPTLLALSPLPMNTPSTYMASRLRLRRITPRLSKSERDARRAVTRVAHPAWRATSLFPNGLVQLMSGQSKL
ncbi:hypothetical protein LX32DRAFT_20202 [Colletotrichum zoysiae]|uniref:Uncharacterized protein n=1 Tax=Colletotrichum zoysiae TaxID=1216348 RepID=A0AAD9HE74_9PEZI|nr:hypothetical protein LX32DRAFT_20202 [Colletotrichum zoysiae]